MDVSEFDYELPEHLIAQFPPEVRGASRLLSRSVTGDVEHLQFADLPGLLKPDDLLVLNDTQVIRGRLFGRKESGGKVEILVERLISPTRFLAQVRASKPLRDGGRVVVDRGVPLRCLGRVGEFFDLEVEEGEVQPLLDAVGRMPLPPYIKRDPALADLERYQTVYGRRPGAVAAPTAGLHFSEMLLDSLVQRAVRIGYVTLHVGAGTFQPVRVARVEDHVMHGEFLNVSADLCRQVEETRAAGGRVIAVGTTSARSLESAAAGGELQPFCGESRLFIYPGYRFRVVDGLITNFHLPGSTLLMLVSALIGREEIMRLYRLAIEQEYRFFSYGDAMLLWRAQSTSTPQ